MFPGTHHLVKILITARAHLISGYVYREGNFLNIANIPMKPQITIKRHFLAASLNDPSIIQVLVECNVIVRFLSLQFQCFFFHFKLLTDHADSELYQIRNAINHIK